MSRFPLRRAGGESSSVEDARFLAGTALPLPATRAIHVVPGSRARSAGSLLQGRRTCIRRCWLVVGISGPTVKAASYTATLSLIPSFGA